jgi:D-alanyl-D-alanine carboxypeptidase
VPVSDIHKAVVGIDKSILLDDTEKPIILKSDPVIKKEIVKPYITAESYLVANLLTGERYIQFNTDKVFPIASVSKLYTALVVHHLLDPDMSITITKEMLDAYGEAGNLMIDEKFTPDELLHFLLLVSSNDAAEAFAYSFGYEKFIENMNAFAIEIGMKNTSFKDASGLSSGNVSTVNDLFKMAQYLYRSEPDILRISKTPEFNIATTTDHGAHKLVNIDPFVTYTEFIGGKTGRTIEAKESMVTLYNKKVGDMEYPIAVILLRSELGEREMNTEKLIEQFENKLKK